MTLLRYLTHDAREALHWVLLFLFSLWEYCLGKLKNTVARSTWGLVLYCGRRLLKRKMKMKTILSIANGAVILSENEGVFSLNLIDSASVGGGEAAGVIKVSGQASIILDAQSALKLGEALLNSHLPPAMQPVAQIIEGIANQAIAALE